MKTLKTAPSILQRQEAEQAFLARAQWVFRAYPELLSFCIEEDSAACAFPAMDEEEKFDLYVGLATAVSDDFQQEMCEAVSEFISEVVQDDPETLEILRGRTFTRTLH